MTLNTKRLVKSDSDIKLFRMEDGKVTQLIGFAVSVEKSLQNLAEGQVEPLRVS
jgi:hypothetical protein